MKTTSAVAISLQPSEMKTIYRMKTGFIQMDSYGEIHKSHHLLKAVVAALILAASISTIAALVSKYPPVDPQIIKADKTSVIGY
jgi:capsular polysaccharide biosynthesis protein